MKQQLFTELAINDSQELIFGTAPKPVECGNGLTIGNGLVYPEINFTLPTMSVTDQTWGEVINQYENIITDILSRSEKMRIPGLVVEFEQLPPMTENPQWGAEITKLLKLHLNRFYDSTGIPNALRVTVIDLRDGERPPRMRDGKYWELTKESFICSAQAGADILSIESVGGKEVHDQALMYGDLIGMVASLGILGCKDMAFLWDIISKIAMEYNVVAGGDTACGFANTAMQLAGKGMIPSILAALDRAASAPRSLVAYEHGAIGPSKDCAYEGPIIKAITGCPISMEGKSSSCAHFSPLGNIAAATADLWSNESVQNIRLLSGSAPEAYMELLGYDCRLFNTPKGITEKIKLRDWLVASDVPYSVEALMLDPQVVLDIASDIIKYNDGLNRTIAAVKVAYTAITNYISSGKLELPEMEKRWLEKISMEIESLQADEQNIYASIKTSYGDLFQPESYGLD